MQTDTLLALIETELNERKAINLIVLDVRDKTSFTDFMIVTTGTSGRHLKALCDYVEMKVKENGVSPLGMEGDSTSDWILLDLGDVIVHAMTEQAREYYQLEKLWTVGAGKEAVTF